MDFEQAYENIRQSELNNLVGGADPKVVGDACLNIINRHYSIKSEDNVLDFGCGAGRVLLSVLKWRNDFSRTVGIDIMPEAIRFCRKNIGTLAPNMKFELLNDKNDHYQRHISESEAGVSENFRKQYSEFFDFTYAFSVFTHIAHSDFSKTLGLIADVTKLGGKALITAFILTPVARANIDSKLTTFQFERPEKSADGKVFIGDSADPLAFIAYDINEIERMFWSAGLCIEQIEFGAWRGIPGNSLQDIVICRKV